MPNFRALQGALLVAPILQKLIFNREPAKVIDWVERVSKWPFKRIIPCHFANNIASTPAEFKAAFDFLLERKTPNQWIKYQKYPMPIPADMELLTNISSQLTKLGVINKEASLL